MNKIKIYFKSGSNICTVQSIEKDFDICALPICCTSCSAPIFNVQTDGCIEEYIDVDEYYRIDLTYNIVCEDGSTLDWSNLRYNDVLNLSVTVEYDSINNSYYLKVLKSNWTSFLSSNKIFNIDILDCGVLKTLSYVITEDFSTIEFCTPCINCNLEDAVITMNNLCYSEFDENNDYSPIDIMIQCGSTSITDPSKFTLTASLSNCNYTTFFESGRWYVKRLKNCDNYNFSLSICLEVCDSIIEMDNCKPLFIASNSDLYGYDYNTLVITSLGLPNKFTMSSGIVIEDIAHTSDKLWILKTNTTTNLSELREWDIVLNTYSSSYSRDIILPIGSINYGAGLFAVNNTTLICSTIDNFGNSTIVEIDVTNINALVINKFALPIGYFVMGDMLLSTSNELFVILGNGTNNSYLYQYNYTNGTLISSFQLNTTQMAYGMFVQNSTLYITCSLGAVYSVNLSTQIITQVSNVPSSLNGASSLLSCNTI